jgi:two-component system response regulator HydG
MMEQGKFRDDLYYRISVVTIFLPPLRERRIDIPILTDHFLKEFSEKYRKEVQGVSRGARQALLAYDWPGNIRQLRNTIERMLVLDTDGLLDVNDLPQEISTLAGDDADGLAYPHSGVDMLVGRPLKDVEAFYIRKALDLTAGNREEAARMLGIGERTLYRKIKEYGLKD